MGLPKLFVVFVDFKKAFDKVRRAFDKVRRDLLLERCRKLGVHGPFLDMLVALYDSRDRGAAWRT
jgi:hypothetical protein